MRRKNALTKTGSMLARNIQINGIVQGVGFRPHVAKLARSLGCTGWVLNNTDGVEIHIQHDDAGVLAQFEKRLAADAPQAAHILSVTSHDAAIGDFEEFLIRISERGSSKTTLISPDLATCPDCLRELFDPEDRRYHYPFINCTNCGPRFTIIEDLPYDRPVTSMRAFEMCPECRAEYEDDANRRYHAQPNACFTCGPQLWWAKNEQVAQDKNATLEGPAVNGRDVPRDSLGRRGGLVGANFTSPAPAQMNREERPAEHALETSDELIERAALELEAGRILAIKGLGGWHLACDAENEDAVATLRHRKHRPSKPLAIMVRDIDAARRLAYIDDAEERLLHSSARPIVLLEKRCPSPLATGIAGELPEIGIMLPSTPVQHLLMQATDRPLVMTSANRSGEPIVADDEEAFEALASIADAFLGNNRKIVARYDDSVARIAHDERTQMIRRARGYAPMPLITKSKAAGSASVPTIFAAGPEQKATFATLASRRVFISQHLGDLERRGSWLAWDEARERYEQLFDARPSAIACDMHPEYLASKWARRFAAEHSLPLVEVQHHHANIASVMGENELMGPVIGIALDGTGYGTDKTIWGGEILIATRKSFERFWHLPCFKLPGGAAAIYNPQRSAYSLLNAYGSLDDPFFGQFSPDNPQFAPFLETIAERDLLDQMLAKDINSPVCSSAGRLFDAVSALLGICAHPSYDGEAACLLEAHAHADLRSANSQASAPLTAWSFHAGLIMAIIEQALKAREATGITDLALGGGCMVNRIISRLLEERLRDCGFDVYVNRELPPNDGCIAHGQAIVAQARLEE